MTADVPQQDALSDQTDDDQAQTDQPHLPLDPDCQHLASRHSPTWDEARTPLRRIPQSQNGEVGNGIVWCR